MKSHPAVIFFYFLNKEYVLAHTEMPTTLEGAEAAIKKQEDFMTTMDANEEKINAVVETGRRLVSDGNINSDRIQEKVDSIDDRYGVLRFLRDSQPSESLTKSPWDWIEISQWLGYVHRAKFNYLSQKVNSSSCLKIWFVLSDMYKCPQKKRTLRSQTNP